MEGGEGGGVWQVSKRQWNIHSAPDLWEKMAPWRAFVHEVVATVRVVVFFISWRNSLPSSSSSPPSSCLSVVTHCANKDSLFHWSLFYTHFLHCHTSYQQRNCVYKVLLKSLACLFTFPFLSCRQSLDIIFYFYSILLLLYLHALPFVPYVLFLLLLVSLFL